MYLEARCVGAIPFFLCPVHHQCPNAAKEIRKLLEEVGEFGKFNQKEFLWLLVPISGWTVSSLSNVCKFNAGLVEGGSRSCGWREKYDDEGEGGDIQRGTRHWFGFIERNPVVLSRQYRRDVQGELGGVADLVASGPRCW